MQTGNKNILRVPCQHNNLKAIRPQEPLEIRLPIPMELQDEVVGKTLRRIHIIIDADMFELERIGEDEPDPRISASRRTDDREPPNCRPIQFRWWTLPKHSQRPSCEVA